MKKTILISAILISMILIGGFGLWTRYRCQKLQVAFDNLPIGTMKFNLISTLGAPWRHGKCGDYFGGNSSPGCAEELIYANPFAPLIPEYYSFEFNNEQRLIDKYEWESP